MINRVTLVGHLGADPEIRNIGSGTSVARLRVATSENYKNRAGEWQEETQWHDVVAWRMLADRAQQQMRKGSLVYIEGKLTHRKWEDQQGNPRKSTEVVAAMFRVLDGRRESGGESGPDLEPEENLPF
jgi:single-strand DNA-binding protein